MPIEQGRVIFLAEESHRLISVLDMLILQSRNIRRAPAGHPAGQSLISLASSAIDHITDPTTRHIVETLLSALTSILDQIDEAEPTPQTRMQVLTELQHFKAFAKQNERARRYAERKRLGTAIRANPQHPAAIEAEIKALTETLNEKYWPAPAAPTAPVPPPEGQRAPPEGRTLKDGTVAYMPPDDELNADPELLGKDLF